MTHIYFMSVWELWFLLPKKVSFNTTSPWSDWLLFLSLIGWLLLFLQTISFCSIFPISNRIWATSVFSDISMLITSKYLSVALTFHLRSRIIYPITYWRAKFYWQWVFCKKTKWTSSLLLSLHPQRKTTTTIISNPSKNKLVPLPVSSFQ